MPDTDTRPRVQVAKPVTLDQLAAEVGTALAATLDAERNVTEVVVADPASTVTAETLTAAIAAHTPTADYGKPAEDVGLSAIRAKAQAVAAGDGAFTAAQVQKILAHLVLRTTR